MQPAPAKDSSGSRPARLRVLPLEDNEVDRELVRRAQQRRAGKALRQAEARFRDNFENAMEGIYQTSPSGRLLWVNRAMARICGYASPEDLRAGVHDLGQDLHVEPLRRVEFDRLLQEHGEVLAYESRIRRGDGVTIWISENTRAVRGGQGDLLHYEGRVTDITGHKMADAVLRHSEELCRLRESQLIQARQLEAAGQLARGLAHDYNNELGIIMGWARLLLDRGNLTPDAGESLSHIVDAGNRAANLTLKLQVFSRQPWVRAGGDASEMGGEEHHPSAGGLFFQKSC